MRKKTSWAYDCPNLLSLESFQATVQEGKSKSSLIYSLSWGYEAESMRRSRWLEFSGQRSWEERNEQRTLEICSVHLEDLVQYWSMQYRTGNSRQQSMARKKKSSKSEKRSKSSFNCRQREYLSRKSSEIYKKTT